MARIPITVTKRKATVGTHDDIIEGNKGVDYLEVTFDNEWNGYTKTIVWYAPWMAQPIETDYVEPDEDDETALNWIPSVITSKHGRFYVSFNGRKPGQTEALHTETIASAIDVKPGDPISGVEPAPEAPDILSRMLAAALAAENVNATLTGTTLTVTNRQGVSTSSNVQGPQGATGATGPQGNPGPQGEPGQTGPTGAAIVSTVLSGQDPQGGNIYTQTFDNGTTATFTAPKGATGATGPQGQPGQQGQPGTPGTPGRDGSQVTVSATGTSTDEVSYITIDGVEKKLAGGSGGTSDHTQLTNRDAANQHPISAIQGLQSALDGKGTYSKPSNGIPSTDMTQAVQTSLSKADSALQEHQSLASYRTSAAQDVIDAGKQSTIADLSTIRAGAGLGATAVQPAAIADMASKTWVEGKGYVDSSYHDAAKQDVISDLATIRSGAALGATALQEHQSLAAYRTSSAQDAIDAGKLPKSGGTMTGPITLGSGDGNGILMGTNSGINVSGTAWTVLGFVNGTYTIGCAAYPTNIRGQGERLKYLGSNLAFLADVDAVNAKIPAAATSSNQLADKNFVNSSINSVTAYYITKTAAGAQFATYSELAAATTFYSGGEVRVPTRNDYCIVQADENHEDATTRYIYQNSQWEFQYVVNETALTSDQIAALNSGITSGRVSTYDGYASQIAGKEASGTAASAVSSHNSSADAHSSLFANKVDKEAGKGLFSGSYNDLSDKPTIPSAVTEGTVSGWGFTKNAGTITGITMNGSSKGTSGVVNLGTVLTSHQDISGKQDKSNLVTSVSSASTDAQYPSAKCLYDMCGNIETLLGALL